MTTFFFFWMGCPWVSVLSCLGSSIMSQGPTHRRPTDNLLEPQRRNKWAGDTKTTEGPKLCRNWEASGKKELAGASSSLTLKMDVRMEKAQQD